MAEAAENNMDQNVDQQNVDEGNDTSKNTPTVEQLMEQLAAEKAEKERLKNANDKLSKSEAEIKRQLRSKQTTEEAEAEARREADEAKQKAYENAMAELNQMKATQAYNGVLTDTKNVQNIISAVDEKDHNGIAEIVKSEINKAVKAAQAEWLKTRPPVSHGTGASNMSKEDILAITDPIEQQRAIAQNLDLFK